MCGTLPASVGRGGDGSDLHARPAKKHRQSARIAGVVPKIDVEMNADQGQSGSSQEIAVSGWKGDSCLRFDDRGEPRRTRTYNPLIKSLDPGCSPLSATVQNHP